MALNPSNSSNLEHLGLKGLKSICLLIGLHCSLVKLLKVIDEFANFGGLWLSDAVALSVGDGTFNLQVAGHHCVVALGKLRKSVCLCH